MRVRFVSHHQRPFTRSLRDRLLAVMAPAVSRTEEIARLHADLGEAFGRVACEAIDATPCRERPSVVGLAGQTVCHLPGRSGGRTVTLQLGNAAVVAGMTRLPVVFDFRQSDVAAGGQGAPLVPWTDYVLFRDTEVGRAIQNVGGIGNVTYVPRGGRPEDVIAFDTGPGNMVIDGLMGRITGGKQRMDRDGKLAAKGTVLENVLTKWMTHPFLRQRPPRTTGRETFGMQFLDSQMKTLRAASSRPEDWVATATALTAATITLSYRRFLPEIFNLSDGCKRRRGGSASANSSAGQPEMVLAGGGSRNRTLIRMLAGQMPELRVRAIDELGIPAEAKEAVSFAILAVARWDGVPSNLTAATGARQRASLGSVCL
jgi:anhydro-N-acetylmuramic acid kinase